MGCCFGRDEDKNPQEQDANERTHLLRNPTDPVSTSGPLTSHSRRKLCFASDTTRLNIPFSNKSAGDKEFIIDGPRAWNSLPQSISDEFGEQRASSLKKGDEQSELNRILHRTANNVIDVSAIETHTMEQHEYMDRARAYSSRVAVVVTGPKKTGTKALPNGVAIPYSVLSAEPVSLPDIHMITLASESAWKAVNNIKVDHKEDLVVQFPIV